MTLDATVIAAIGSALAAILGGVGLVIGGVNKMLRARIEALEKDVVDEKTDHAATQAKLVVSREETDVARAEREAVRRDMQKDIDDLVAARRADRLQHEADMAQRMHELGGRS